MRLKAKVRKVTGKTRHTRGRVENGQFVDSGPIATPAYVEIVPCEPGAYSLLYFGERGDYLADTWHDTVEHAKAQAHLEFEIEEADWEASKE